MISLRRYLHKVLNDEYFWVKDSCFLSNGLKARCEHTQKSIILARARYDWIHLRLQDFKTIIMYHSMIFIITSQLKLYEEKVIDENVRKTTIHFSCIECARATTISRKRI
jgi:hypothetical protein